MRTSNPSRAPTDKDRNILAALDEIETEMKKIGFWKDGAPEQEVGNALAAPTFELWLQCVFLPNARKAATNGKYPKESQVGVMAMRQYDYHSCVEQALNLVSLLHDFDRLVTSK